MEVQVGVRTGVGGAVRGGCRYTGKGLGEGWGGARLGWDTARAHANTYLL